MKHSLLLLFTLVSLSIGTFSLHAEETQSGTTDSIEVFNENSEDDENNEIDIISGIDFKKNIKVGDTIRIDLGASENELIEKNDSTIEFEWNLQGTSSQQGSVFEETFQEYGDKTINLNIYKKEDDEKKLIISKDIPLYVYTEQSYIIYESSMGEEILGQYLEKSKEIGIYTNLLAQISEKEIEKQNFLHLLEEIKNLDGEKENYVSIWGNKSFIFSVLSKINKEIDSTNSIVSANIVLVSPFNTDVLNNYLRNFLSNKSWVKSIILIPESSLSQIRYAPSNIANLEKNLQEKQYEYININTKSEISQVLFISQFVNNLSNKGFGTNSIYIILIIAFLFTGISILKHLIGLSPIGTVIPIAMTLLFFQIGLIPAALILFILIILNLFLSKVTNKYTLLYTPKVSFIIIINIIVIMGLLNVMFSYNILESNISDIIFIILFVVISERLISVILSKEFSEYRFNLLNTILFALVAYIFFSISIVQTVILAYPELILLLIPFNFIIGRFTGLRITEYFRFREVIKNIEE